MLVKKFLNFIRKPKTYRLVKDVQMIETELMRYRLQVKRWNGWSNEVFKTEHPVCWVRSKDEGIQIVKFLKGTIKWQ